jgi:hypothetical protein
MIWTDLLAKAAEGAGGGVFPEGLREKPACSAERDIINSCGWILISYYRKIVCELDKDPVGACMYRERVRCDFWNRLDGIICGFWKRVVKIKQPEGR